MTAPTTTEPPTWKRFDTESPPSGFYWTRDPDYPHDLTIKEVEGCVYLGFGSDGLEDYCNLSLLEYFTQPILPPV
jgi:hypothetical protein